MFNRLHKTILHLLYVYIGNVRNVFLNEMEINIFSQDQLEDLACDMTCPALTIAISEL